MRIEKIYLTEELENVTLTAYILDDSMEITTLQLLQMIPLLPN